MDLAVTEQLQAVLVEYITHSENGIAVLDTTDRVIFYNHTFLSMFGLEGVPLLDRNVNDVLTWMFTQGVGANIHASTLDGWLEFAHDQYRSVPFRSFEVDFVDSRWLLMSKQVNLGCEVVLVSTDRHNPHQAGRVCAPCDPQEL